MRLVFFSAAAAVVVLAATGAEAKRALAPEAPYADFSPVVSPDGTRLAFLREGITPSRLVRLPSLYTAAADGHGVVALTKGSAQSSSNAQLGHFDEVTSASWSPDGSRLVYAHAYQGTRYDFAHSELVVVDADGTNPHPLTTTDPGTFLRADSPSWSSARNQIAFAAGNIWIVNPNGTDLTELIAFPGEEFTPAWSPDGSKIAFISGHDELAVMNADGTDAHVLSSLSSQSPAWSPDGATIVFSARVDHNTDIYAAAPDGFDLRRLTTDPAEDITPTWTPGGSSIIFGSSRGRGIYNGDLWIMNADGSQQRMLYPRAVKHASNGRRCTITGTVAADALKGTPGADVLCGFDGNDQFAGLAGKDVLDGGKGKDVLDAGAGNDLILARDRRRDDVQGGTGFDRAQVDRGVDKVRGVEKLLP